MRKNFQQLDLFGSIPETHPVETIVPVQEIASSAVLPENNTVVFANESVVFKVKTKTPPANPEQPKEVVKINHKRGRKSFKDIDIEVDLIDIPDEEILRQKLYYPISEVAGWFKVNTSLLRYWENEFDILQPRKTRKGDRLFRIEDIKNLQLIYFLLRQRKFSIEGARNYLKNNKKEADSQIQIIQSLTKFKAFLLELKVSLDD